MKDEDCVLDLLYWIPKLHKCPYKQRYITGAAECSTKPLLKILTYILTAPRSPELLDLLTLYSTIPNKLLNYRAKELIKYCFSKKNGEQRYLVNGRDKSYFVKSQSKYNKDKIIQTLDFLINNIFGLCGGLVFQQTIGISIGTNCAPLHANLFSHAYEADFRQGLLKNKDRKLAQTLNSILCYIDDIQL